jgi:hypothetical protein
MKPIASNYVIQYSDLISDKIVEVPYTFLLSISLFIRRVFIHLLQLRTYRYLKGINRLSNLILFISGPSN